MAISYNDWKKQYDALDSAWKQRYADLTKGSALWQQYMNQYNSEKNTPTIWWQPIKTTQVAKNTTPTIWWKEIKAQTPSTNNPTIWWKSLLNNGTRPTWESVLWWKGIQEVDISWSSTIGNSTPATLTRPVWESILGWNNIKEVDVSNNSSKPKSIFDKPENPVKDFKVLWINPYWKWTEQKWKTTTKQPSVSTPRNTWYVSPKQQERDYQDNSQARMDQIADNLNKYKQTNPELFKDYDSFYNFFIAWKGRSEDQKRFLDQYYADYKQNEKWNNMSADDVWSWIANGTIPEDYINTVASTDPNRAAAIKDALKNTQDWIANAWYLDSLASAAWFRTEKSSQTNWASREWLFIDEDNNWIDDRREHYATQEERELNDWVLEATRRLMSNHVAERDQIDNIIDQYPDIDYWTAVLLANDRNQKLYKQDDALNISIAQMNWTLQYLQKEREERNKAWADTINQLQKNYGIYMEYSPEWIKELADAQYEATHPSLDKAENWTDTDKARALESILKWYYDKYWDIIQRPMEQVIQDVIAESKASGKSLSDALKDNFITPLRNKPNFESITSWGSWVQWTKIGKDADWNDVYWFVNTDTMTVSPYWNVGWTSYTPEQINSNRGTRVKAMQEMAMWNDSIEWMANAIAQGMNGMWDWDYECWAYTNDYIWAVTWNKWGYGNSIQSKIDQTDNQSWDWIQIWDAIVFDWTKNTPQWVKNADEATKKKLLECWHVWFVTGRNTDWSITISHTNGWVVTETTIAPWSDFYNSFVGSQHIKWNKAAVNGYNEQRANEYTAFLGAADKPDTQKSIAKWLWLSVEEFREQANAYSRSQTADQYWELIDIIDNLISDIDSWEIPSFRERKQLLNDWWFEWWVSNSDTNSDWYADNQRLVSVLWLDALINLKWRWATFGALSDSEREAINSYANSLWNPMSDTKYREALNNIKNKLLNSAYWKYFNYDPSKNTEYDPRAWI